MTTATSHAGPPLNHGGASVESACWLHAYYPTDQRSAPERLWIITLEVTWLCENANGSEIIAGMNKGAFWWIYDDNFARGVYVSVQHGRLTRHKFCAADYHSKAASPGFLRSRPVVALLSSVLSTITMMDFDSLVDEFSSKFVLSEETEERLVLNAQPDLALQTGPRSPHAAVGVCQVSTFVAEKSFHNFAVPHFATHWGVVCDSPNARTLYHLTYNPSARSMRFSAMAWEPELDRHSIFPIGTTHYTYDEVMGIGSLLF